MSGKRSISSRHCAIIGAGPAGTAAAITCAGAGMTVSLFERAAFPRDRPGETLHPGAEPILRRLGVFDDVATLAHVRHEGQWTIDDGGQPRFVAFGSDRMGSWRGFQVLRSDLDRTLLARASALGVAIHQPCKVSGPSFDGGRLVGVATDSGIHACDYLINATGHPRWVGEARRSSPPLHAFYGYCTDEPELESLPRFSCEPQGWTWIARIRRDLIQWTRLAWPDTNVRDSLRWSRERPAELARCDAVARVRAADVTWRIADPAPLDRVFLVGDAAFRLDPASSHGVLKALMTGMMAAQAIGSIEGGTMTPVAARTGYARWIQDWFERDVSQLRRFYAERVTGGLPAAGVPPSAA
ncbi:MAG TPA: FAD-dependent monooxygenase [Kofleriaceae bacterium]|nr:FAD-dependent monooxygenase [Kofleriaceae bacterium]